MIQMCICLGKFSYYGQYSANNELMVHITFNYHSNIATFKYHAWS